MDIGFLTETKRQVQFRLSSHLLGKRSSFLKPNQLYRELTLIGPDPDTVVDSWVDWAPYISTPPHRQLILCEIDKVIWSKAKEKLSGINIYGEVIFPLDRPWDCLDPNDWTEALEVDNTGFSTNPITGFDLDFCKPLKDLDTVEAIANLVYCTGTSPCWVRVTNSVGRVNTLEEHNFYTDKLIRLLINDQLDQLLYLEKVSYLGGHSNKYPMRVLQVIIENKREEMKND